MDRGLRQRQGCGEGCPGGEFDLPLGRDDGAPRYGVVTVAANLVADLAVEVGGGKNPGAAVHGKSGNSACGAAVEAVGAFEQAFDDVDYLGRSLRGGEPFVGIEPASRIQASGR